MKQLTLIFSIVAFLAVGCTSSKTASQQTTEQRADTVATKDTVTETAETEADDGDQIEEYRYHFFEGYQPSRTRYFDLLHTELHVSFDWEKEHLLGKAKLTLTPYFYPQDQITLDAKHMDLHEVAMLQGEADKTPLEFTYDTTQVTIDLPRQYDKGEQLDLFIDYTAKPNESRDEGSAAIARGQGLYFINADGSDTTKPRQLWTQGEPESNSHWFPTIDAPNERTTQDIYITVADTLTTLSNGAKMSAQRNDDGSRTDHWRMEKPHAPYLFMMAVGDFVVTKDQWRGMPVNYYMEPKYAPYARDVFGNTPEMLDYFSDVLGVTYPWSKYSQVVVRDFVSGAMENTTASVFYGQLNSTRQDLVDRSFDDIIAHELIHHWFGDLVTCESWANIPLNEAFATYGEVMWQEHKNGLDAADAQRLNDLRVYLMAGSRNLVPMIRYYHSTPGAMFDPNSYQRGGATLGMLREYVGDEAFYAALKHYLTEHQYEAVEIHDLRLAFEKVTGEDLNWFFDQWFLTKGFPEMEMKVQFDSTRDKYSLDVSQRHAYNEAFTYRLPITVQVYTEQSSSKQRVWLTTEDSTYYFPADANLIIPDPGKMLVGEVSKTYPRAFYKEMLREETRYFDRKSAIDSLADFQEQDEEAYQLIHSKLEDPYYRIRSQAIKRWEPKRGDYGILRKLALNDPSPSVRASAVNKVFLVKDTSSFDVFYKAIEDSSSQVASEALYLLNEVDPENIMQYTARFEHSDNGNILTTMAEIYADNAGAEKISFFTRTIRKDLGWSRYIIMNRFAEFLGRLEDRATIEQGIKEMSAMARDGGKTESYVAFRGLKRLKGDLEERAELSMQEDEQTMLADLIKSMEELIEKIYETSDNEMIQSSGVD